MTPNPAGFRVMVRKRDDDPTAYDVILRDSDDPSVAYAAMSVTPIDADSMEKTVRDNLERMGRPDTQDKKDLHTAAQRFLRCIASYRKMRQAWPGVGVYLPSAVVIPEDAKPRTVTALYRAAVQVVGRKENAALMAQACVHFWRSPRLAKLAPEQLRMEETQATKVWKRKGFREGLVIEGPVAYAPPSKPGRKVVPLKRRLSR